MTADTHAGSQHVQTINRFFDAIQAGDYPVLLELLTPDAITRWPQSGERITGAASSSSTGRGSPG